MLITKGLIPIPSRKIVVDLALRNGSPNRESTCPYDGQASEAYRQCREGEYWTLINILESEYTADYDAHKQKPVAGQYFKREGATEGVTDYLTRLEDIDSSWVIQYYKNAITGAKLHRAGGILEYRKRHVESRVIEDEDGEYIQELDLEIDRPDYSAIEIMSWKEKIPYILKRLHDKSKACGIGILSLIIAYEKVLKNKIGQDAKPKPTEMLDQGVWKMNKSGHLVTRVLENKGMFQEYASKWIRGQEDYVDSYFHDAMELLDICEKLNIDITNEDPEEYQEEFINSLTVLYITKNREFIGSSKNRANPEILKELKSIVMADYNKKLSSNEDVDWYHVTRGKMQKFLISSNPKIIRDINKETAMSIFIALYNLRNKTNYNIMKLRTSDGFYLSKGSSAFLLDVTDITLDPTPYYSRVFAVLHSSGYLVLVTNTRYLYFLDIETAIDYQKDLNNGRLDKYIRYSRNQKFGKWEWTLL